MKTKHQTLLLLAIHWSVAQVHAADVIKANNTDALGLGSSWTGASAPAPGDVAVWNSTVTAANSAALGADLSWQGIRIADPGGAVTISSGNTLTLGSAGIDLSSATQNLTLNAATTVGANQSWNVASGRTLLRSGTTTTFGTGTTTTLSGAGTVEFGGTQSLTGSGDWIIDGPTLFNNLQGGTQSRSGTTTLTSGIIKIQTSVSMFGSGTLHLNGGAVGSGNATARTITNTVNVGGAFRVGGADLSSGAIVFSGPADFGGSTRTIDSFATGLATNIGSGAVFSGIVSNGGITKTGSGILTLTGANTYTGATTVNAGSLAINQNALLNSESVTLATSGVALYLGQNGAGTHTLNNLGGVSGTAIRTDFTLSGTNTARSLTINQTINGEFAGTFVQGGSRAFEIIKTGAAILTLSGAGGHTLGTTISGGSLKIGGVGLLGSASYAGTITNNATLHFDSSSSQTLTGTLTGSGSLLKSGTGALTISGTASGFGGNTTVSGGILTLDSAIGGNLAATGGRLILNSSISGNVSASSGATFGGTGGSTGDLDMTSGSSLLLTGGGTTTGMQFDGVTFGGTVYLEFASSPVDATVYDVVTYGAGGRAGFASLSPLARGTLTDDVANSKITFTSGAPGTRTWDTGSGTWNRFGILQNWAEGDKVYYQGDAVVFGDIPSDTTITLDGLLAPLSVTVGNSANTYTFAGSGGLSGSGFLEKTGTGLLVITNPNTNFTGATYIDAGIFRITDGGTWGTGSITNNAALEINQTTNLTLAGTISGTGTLHKTGTGILRLTGTNSYSGGTTFNGGILQMGNNAALGTGTLTINGGTLSSDSATTRTFSNNLVIASDTVFGDGTNTGQLVIDGTVDLQGSTRVLTSVLGTQGARFNGVISNGGMTKAGAGRITLANDTNTFAGATTINEGILATSIGALANSSSVTIASGGELALGANGTTLIQNLSGAAGSLIVSNFNISTDGARTLEVNQTIDGEFAGSNTQGTNRVISLVKSGSALLSLTGSSTYTGTTTVSAGTLKIGGNGVLGGGSYAGNITNDSTLHFDSAATQTISGTISGTGALLKSNIGTLIHTNHSTYTGATTVTGGTLAVNGSLGNTAVTVQTGAALSGNGNIGGSVTIESGATHTLAVAATAGAQVTRTIGGTLTLNPGNILTLTAAATPANGAYILATATGGISGSPGTINLAPQITGTVTISGNNLVLTVGSDYDSWAGPSGYNLTQGPTGDDDGDGLTNFEEYAFGLNPTSGSGISPVTAPDKTAGTFTYTRRKQSLTGLGYSYQSSTSLAGWSAFTPASESTNNGDPVEIITVTLPPALLSEGELFLRVKALQP